MLLFCRSFMHYMPKSQHGEYKILLRGGIMKKTTVFLIIMFVLAVTGCSKPEVEKTSEILEKFSESTRTVMAAYQSLDIVSAEYAAEHIENYYDMRFFIIKGTVDAVSYDQTQRTCIYEIDGYELEQETDQAPYIQEGDTAYFIVRAVVGRDSIRFSVYDAAK